MMKGERFKALFQLHIRTLQCDQLLFTLEFREQMKQASNVPYLIFAFFKKLGWKGKSA